MLLSLLKESSGKFYLFALIMNHNFKEYQYFFYPHNLQQVFSYLTYHQFV
jgi:hypothetical protein